MTGQERLKALFSYRTPDRIPMGSMGTGFSARNAGYQVRDVFEDPEICFDAVRRTAEQYAWDPIPQYPGHTIWGAIDFGGDVRLPDGEYESSLIIKSYPVQSESDLQNLRMPDPRTAGMIPLAMRFAELQAKHGLPVFFSSRSPFTLAANICGIENFCRWMIKHPELCRKLLNIAITHIFNVLEYWVETFGAEKLFIWMSTPSESNQVISPKHMAKFALPYHLEYHQRLRALGITRFGLHLCGEQNANLPLLADADPWPHPSVLSFGHEVDISEAAQYFPSDIIFGNVDPTMFQMGTPRRIYELCRQVIAEGKKAPGGFILAPGCGIPATAPPVNVYAMTRAVLDFGRYQ